MSLTNLSMTLLILHVHLSHKLSLLYIFFTECAKHCSLCYNGTECYECTAGYSLNDEMECESMSINIFYYTRKSIRIFNTFLRR